MSTLTTPPNGCSPRDDAAQLHKALKGLRSDTAKIVNILAHRDSEQRDLIQQAYETSFSEPLYKRISTDLHGHVKRALKLWLHDALTRDAIIIRKALTSSPVVDYQAVNEIICSRTPSQIRRFKDAYLSTYHSNLDEDLDKQLSGDHKKLLVAYITIQRYEGPELDEALVQQDAQQLYKSADKKIGTDEKTLIRIFSERSSTHLAAVSSAYKASFGTPLEKALKQQASGLFLRGLLTILRCAINPSMYFAKILRKAIKGMGTGDTRLIRVIVTRTEIDMQYIKEAYLTKYGKPLSVAVRSDTSGHYRDFLLQLLGSDY
ncbi:hypothetical protein HN51_060675 [Arachis hypogaea]|uniref:annexin D5-like n=1 Tax=Arachis ipaensis TaxID=130454 RepID=UPI0007AFC0E1|nr:annexin D5-like [Arachis ipaensis]XP_025685748.1 annexin D5-like [Arachis hypogaea]